MKKIRSNYVPSDCTIQRYWTNKKFSLYAKILRKSKKQNRSEIVNILYSAVCIIQHNRLWRLIRNTLEHSVQNISGNKLQCLKCRRHRNGYSLFMYSIGRPIPASIHLSTTNFWYGQCDFVRTTFETDLFIIIRSPHQKFWSYVALKTRNVGQCPTWWPPCLISVAPSIQHR